MIRTRNPFYGVGLAVHEYTADCTECRLTVFLDNAEDPNSSEASVTRRGPFARLSNAVARLKAALTKR
jgi:hypothetical protein